MMAYLPGILGLLIAAAGWHYLFHSRAADELAGIEDQRVNRMRVRLRRINGFMMGILGAIFYITLSRTDPERSPTAFVVGILATLILLGIVVVLVLVDLKLTMRLRRRVKE